MILIDAVTLFVKFESRAKIWNSLSSAVKLLGREEYLEMVFAIFNENWFVFNLIQTLITYKSKEAADSVFYAWCKRSSIKIIMPI